MAVRVRLRIERKSRTKAVETSALVNSGVRGGKATAMELSAI